MICGTSARGCAEDPGPPRCPVAPYYCLVALNILLHPREEDIGHMGHWNYRVIRHQLSAGLGHVSYAIHEVHYDNQGNPIALTENPVKLVADSPTDLLADIELMREAARRPTLDYSSFPGNG